jgi:hypothetical protein
MEDMMGIGIGELMLLFLFCFVAVIVGRCHLVLWSLRWSRCGKLDKSARMNIRSNERQSFPACSARGS